MTANPPATQSNVRLSGRLPKGALNGLTDLAKDLVNDPEKVRVIVGIVKVEQIIDVVANDHEKFPRLALTSVEAITNPDDQQAVRDAMQAAYRERTGSDELPFGEDDERMATAAEQHLADNPDSVLGKKK